MILPHEEQVALAREWVRGNASKLKSLTRWASSYRIKHVIENELHAEEHYYIGEAAAIEAMLAEGWKAKLLRPGGLSCSFQPGSLTHSSHTEPTLV
jgi:hypothetical protein